MTREKPSKHQLQKFWSILEEKQARKQQQLKQRKGQHGQAKA